MTSRLARYLSEREVIELGDDSIGACCSQQRE
jgi:hypothetical protein